MNYIAFVDDSIVYGIIAPLYKDGGRPPKQPISQFRAHYLYFTKPEITSYRHLERVLNFAQESNSLDSVMRHKKLPVRGLKRVQIFAVMTDMFRLIKEMLKHIRQTKIPKTRDELLKKAYQQQLTQYSAA